MTLVLSSSISGRFAIMTSDYRRVDMNYIHYENGDIKADPDSYVISEVKDIKTHKLSKFVLVGAGGDADLSSYLANILKQEVKEEHDLSDCKEILEAVIERERANTEGPEILKFLNIKEGVSVVMNGFYRDGSTGNVWFDAGKDTVVAEEKSPLGSYQYGTIAPSKEYFRRTDELFNIPKLADESMYDGVPESEIGNVMFQAVLNHLILIHGVASFNHPVTISPDFEVHIIAMNKGVLDYNMTNFDYTETHAQFHELKKQIEAS